MKKVFRHWRIIYAVCCLVYMGWIIHVGGNEFDRINSQYRSIVKQLDEGRIKTAALKELTDDCRRDSREHADLEEDGCYAWPPEALVAKGQEIKGRLLRTRERGIIKVVLFYTGFVLIFLLGPTILTYLLIVGVTRVYKSIKFVRH